MVTIRYAPREDIELMTTTPPPHTLPLLVLAGLMRALSHKIRTPLSVISNDLSFFKSCLPTEDVDRSLQKVKVIGDILRSASDGAGVVVGSGPVTVGDWHVASQAAGWSSSPAASGEGALQLGVTHGALSAIARYSHELLGGSAGSLCALVVLEDRVTQRICLPSSVTIDSPRESLTESIPALGCGDSLLPPILDAIVWASGGSLSVGRCGEPVVEISFPILR